MANILIISGNLSTWEKNSGGVERTATLAEALDKHDVTFLSFSWNVQSEVKKIKNINFIRPGADPAIAKKHKIASQNEAKNNHDVTKHMYKKYLNAFTKKATVLAQKADLIILDHFSVSPLIEKLVGLAPIVYNSHNSELSMARQLHPEDKFVNDIVESMEAFAIKNSIGMTYCSEKDFEEMKANHGAVPKLSKYIPNGTVMQDMVNYRKRLNSKDLIFVGSAHPPNVVAAKRVVELAKLDPKHNFLICGTAGNSIDKKSLPDNVFILGMVPEEELDKLFKESLAFINPMESGSGTHLKMMKALSYGIPIITSFVGARGFTDKEMQESMIIADTNEELVEAIKTLNNEKAFKTLSNNSYKLSKKFDWELIKKEYADFIKEVLGDKATKSSSLVEHKKKKVLVYSIIRNTEKKFDQYYTQLKKMVQSFPEYEFYLSIYENDSTDNTKKKLHTSDWSFFSGVSIISENINTEFFGSVKDPVRVENLSKARNKAIEAGGFLDKVDYVLMVEGDLSFTNASVRELLEFKKLEPKFDVVSAMSIRRDGSHYDWWATRTTAKYKPEASEIDPGYKRKHYGEYYSTSNGLVLYRAEPFKKGVRHGWINTVTKEFDCEMVVLCQNLRAKGYKNIYINYRSTTHV